MQFPNVLDARPKPAELSPLTGNRAQARAHSDPTEHKSDLSPVHRTAALARSQWSLSSAV